MVDNNATWVQRDGAEILVKDMSSSHIKNTIRLLERYISALEEERNAAWAISCMVTGEMASLCIDNDIDDLEDYIFDVYRKIKMFEDELNQRKCVQ